eukprot:s3_g13.t1
MGRWSQSHKVAAPAAGACPRQGNQKAPRRHGDQILPGYWVQCLSSGEVEFLPSSGEEDVRGYRETLLAIKLRAAGHGPQEIAQRLFRSEAWVRDKMMLEPSKIPKPKGMESWQRGLPITTNPEWWDADGFCDVTYFRGDSNRLPIVEPSRPVQSKSWMPNTAGYAKEAGLYEEIVSTVDWEQETWTF